MVLQFREQCDEVMHAGVRLLRAGLEQIKELFVVPEELSN